MAFCPGSPENAKVGTLVTLQGHNFVCKHPIRMTFKAKLSRTFQHYVTRTLHARESRQFLTFSGRESIWQFDSRPFF
jgi:hypothetical protein